MLKRQIYKCTPKHVHNAMFKTFVRHYVRTLHPNIFSGLHFSFSFNRQFRHFILHRLEPRCKKLYRIGLNYSCSFFIFQNISNNENDLKAKWKRRSGNQRANEIFPRHCQLLRPPLLRQISLLIQRTNGFTC